MTQISLVIRFSSLGDVVLTSAFTKAHAQTYPDKKLLFITSQAYQNLVAREFFGVDRVITPGNSKLRTKEAFRFGRRVAEDIISRQGNNSISSFEIYDLQGTTKSFLFSLGVQVFFFKTRFQWPKRMCSPKKTLARMLCVLMKWQRDKLRYVFQDHLSLLKDFRPDAHATPELRTQNKKSKSVLVLAPDSQHWKKRWPLKSWETLAIEFLKAKPNAQVRIVGSDEKSILPMVHRLQNQYGDRIEAHLNVAILADLPRLLEGSQLCICNNSAWLHLAEACDVPVLSFAGPIVPYFGFSPWRAKSQELQISLPCRPCDRHGKGECPMKGSDHHACMNRITVDMALKELFAKWI